MRSLALTSAILSTLRRSNVLAFSTTLNRGWMAKCHESSSSRSVCFPHNGKTAAIKTRRFMSFDANEPPPITRIGKEQLMEIFEDIDNAGREETGYVVMDVRELDEIADTGKISPHAITFPLQQLAGRNAFNMEEEDFKEVFGFEKPSFDETLVFSCKAGIRSMHAAQIAGMAGYTNLVNYSGGSLDW
eukprot:CAMPEP_0197832764 /NCGR_PEP_ID=MMETSP1437-20131217/16090_1 /TAXON_ID=49252 ORGANISM="Eucampia antarctica, Strain CCMP1452" /NCGR_SAMPLE_ID=MMETSP1437 /ASSEMBLY_ACC=CAM_ASM_001096 /LENGTH=187 /DNA_ID=CAMNT_0043436337 /DNA_START=32 /DNA_END=592 /DNA_ORIENTATION=+